MLADEEFHGGGILSTSPMEASYHADTSTFETSEHVGGHEWWPKDIVVGKEDNLSCCFLNTSDQLSALVCCEIAEDLDDATVFCR